MLKQKTIEQTLLGIAIGDAFGLGIEFQDKNWIKENVDFSKYVNKREGKYVERYKEGFYSDDTEHSIGLIRAVMSEQPFSEKLLLEEWTKEYERDKKMKGFPRQGHGTIKDFYEGRRTIDQLKESQKTNPHDPGCAPPMRAVPLGLIPSNLITTYATINATSTHPHPLAIDSSILVSRLSEYMIKEHQDSKKAISSCKKFVLTTDFFDYLERINLLPRPNELNENDFEILCGPQPIPNFKHRKVIGVPNSAPKIAGVASYLVKHSKDTFEGLENAIKMGGDIDSLASITTGILSGRYGLSSIPNFMLEELEGRAKLKKLSRDFYSWLNLQEF